ncbi:hypothetical protein SLS62_001940 [Diatrype stigma]|uniref:Developmental regulatory protein wetA n=1 Tax=Diatrype stigma TaxID=117547 RepID=A0AAN9UZ37_9PEZI
MAFTAVHYPMDKDQGHLAYWSDNDELGAVAPESFFDQFVTFDAGDPGATTVGLSADDMFEQDPPSPSLLLDSLKDDRSLASSSNAQQERLSDIGRPAAATGVVGSTAAATTTTAIDDPFTISSPRDVSDAVDLDHLHHRHLHHNGSSTPPPDLLSVLTGDPVLGGSISDSELLRLEGISLRSPKANATAPSSPPFLSQQQTSTPPSLSPRKHHRFVESVYATVRRATHRSSRPATVAADHNNNRHGGGGSPHGTPIMGAAFKRGVRPSRQYQQQQQPPPQQQQQHHYQQQQGPDAHMGHIHHQIAIKSEPVVDNDGLPLSPPLTGTIPTPGHHGMRFVSGNFDDPFCDGLMVSTAAATNGGSSMTIQGQDTPLHTPVLEGADAFYQHGMPAVTEPAGNRDGNGNGNNNAASYRQGKHGSQLHHDNVAAAWSTMDGLLTTSPTDDVQLWASSSAATAPVYIAENDISNPNGNGGELPSPGWWEADCEGGHHPQSHVSNNNVATMHNASLLQQQQITAADMSSYDYGSLGGGNDELSGLMIHMPQPRQPQAAVLSTAAANNLNLNGGSGGGSNEAAADDGNGGSSASTTRALATGADGSSFPMPTLSSTTPSRHQQHYQQQYQRTPHQHPEQPRRARPRAPSSGARHHHGGGGGGSMTSPRKLHHSRSAFSIRESSMSPSPAHHLPHGGRSHLLPPYPPHYHHQQQPPHQHRSSSISVRKRRSFNSGNVGGGGGGNHNRRASSLNGNGEPLPHTPRSATAAASGSFGHGLGGGGGGIDMDLDHAEAGATMTPGGGGRRASSSTSSTSSSNRGAAAMIGFVNFTPSDKNVLMMGVAPSGSSKTKARREKELADRQRRISEATIRAVKEAGGDVDKFIEQGLWGGVFVSANGNANGQQQQQQQHRRGADGHVEHDGGHGGHGRSYVDGERC